MTLKYDITSRHTFIKILNYRQFQQKYLALSLSKTHFCILVIWSQHEDYLYWLLNETFNVSHWLIDIDRANFIKLTVLLMAPL